MLAQQQTVPNPQMQEEADKGAKTRQSGESGYVGEQEKSGASAHAPGRPATASDDGLDQWNEQHFAVWNGREISLSMNWKSGSVFVLDKCEARSRGPCERPYRVGVGPVGDCGK